MRYVSIVENGRTIPTYVRRILVASISRPATACSRCCTSGTFRPYPGLAQYTGHQDHDEYFALHVHELATQRLNDLIAVHPRDGVEIV